MRVIRDMIGGGKPQPIEMPFNGTVDADGGAAYKGQLVKFMDFDDVDHGRFVTSAGNATAMENVCGILEEAVAATGCYLPDDAAYGVVRKKITPIFPSTIIEAEYVQYDAAGTANYDTAASASAGSTTFTAAAISADDSYIGGWIYMLNGAAAGELHYILNSANSGETVTLATAMVNAVVAADDFLVIAPPNAFVVDFNATYTGIKSELTLTSCLNNIVGIDHFISAPGMPKQVLDRNKHDGLVISGAKFFHHFTMPGTTALSTAWITGILQA